jgi:hypothetical protein
VCANGSEPQVLWSSEINSSTRGPIGPRRTGIVAPLRRKIAALAVTPPTAKVDAAQNKFYRSHYPSRFGYPSASVLLGLGALSARPAEYQELW